MGAALKRPFKNYNIENRAMNYVEKSKLNPKASPRYPTEAAIEARSRATQEAETSLLNQKIPELDDRLKQVYVKSEGCNPEIKSKRKLPEDRRAVADPEYGYLEPVTVSQGRISLRQAVELVNSHKDNPEENSAKVLSERYRLDLKTVYLILEYFQPFKLKLPKEEPLVRRNQTLLKDAGKQLLTDSKNGNDTHGKTV